MMEWISTKDRMPDLGKLVLCYLRTRVNDIGYEYRTLKLCKDNNYFYFSDIFSSWPDFSVKFWAELPEPPKEELIAELGGNLNYIASNGTIKNCADELNKLEKEDE